MVRVSAALVLFSRLEIQLYPKVTTSIRGKSKLFLDFGYSERGNEPYSCSLLLGTVDDQHHTALQPCSGV